MTFICCIGLDFSGESNLECSFRSILVYNYKQQKQQLLCVQCCHDFESVLKILGNFRVVLEAAEKCFQFEALPSPVAN
jgi:hypothetical protein